MKPVQGVLVILMEGSLLRRNLVKGSTQIKEELEMDHCNCYQMRGKISGWGVSVLEKS